ncbi:MAG: hypothetical protein PHW53_03290 [Patescibacteria group bacterium]|nr:hypothetical protein [Patescibacteria group bacterium]
MSVHGATMVMARCEILRPSPLDKLEARAQDDNIMDVYAIKKPAVNLAIERPMRALSIYGSGGNRMAGPVTDASMGIMNQRMIGRKNMMRNNTSKSG